MKTKIDLFLESKLDNYNFLENGLKYFFDVDINFDLLIFLLKEKIIYGNTVINDKKLITYIFELNYYLDDDDFRIEKMKLFINLCLETTNINIIDDTGESVYMMVFDYVSEDFFDELVDKYNLSYNDTSFYSDDFIDHIKTKQPNEYKKYMSQQKAKNFNL